ncbi:MAG: polyprenyl synthetase family protein [Candidatus Gracilibacteria bacterium]|nr:polyprenyl synthetase family protein [Candidatus Gracilibacteria bacterium]
MLPTWYDEYKKIIDESIDKYLDLYFTREELVKGLVQFKEAVFYSVKGGKRVRAILALEFYLIFTGKKISELKFNDDIILYCISLELLHAYSLVHDDLPCMDNDEYRRGELTVWNKYSENTAVLVGDLLNSMSFEILSDLSDDVDVKIILGYYGRSVGLFGMLGGQVLDLYYENHFEQLDLVKLIDVHNKKTGTLIEASIVGGIIISDKFDDINKYMEFGKKIGLAFQVKDDLLDVTGSLSQTGKSVGGEHKGFVYFLGEEKSKNYLDQLIKDCHDLIIPLNSDKLNFLVSYIGNRNK